MKPAVLRRAVPVTFYVPWSVQLFIILKEVKPSMHSHSLHTLLQQVYKLLSPARFSCSLCQHTSTLSSRMPGLCRACYAKIPWITQPRCLACGRAIGCPDCSRPEAGPRHFVWNRSAVRYSAEMKEWLALYKYRGHEKIASLLIHMLKHAYVQAQRESLLASMPRSADPIWAQPGAKDVRQRRSAEGAQGLWEADVLTSVPVSDERRRERGFNQAEVLARGLSSAVSVPYCELLHRTRHTDKQSFKSRMDRVRDMENLFAMLPSAPDALLLRSEAVHERNSADSRSKTLRPLRILLLDDIYTTGSTVNACALALKTAAASADIPAEVCCLTWARS
ncbi:amidophosphoribosyltransferase-like protein [Paenibacillus algicola]|uniref:Amidophosphoribosyltransferase-like protein n=1 Tax=Paenibacillus algicola TaxID=2565926 RepID=A0A4P8XQG5_9BACL|nr:ComF family protein [Paenibacillus algicola]QCT04575.1 amidophosphoribosyltransferase-like protein [Paenibacillus algicola]